MEKFVFFWMIKYFNTQIQRNKKNAKDRHGRYEKLKQKNK